MRDKVLSFAAREGLLPPGSRVLAAFSGGADSTALVHLLAVGLPELGLAVRACHINHRIRGEEADRDEAFCRRFCGELGIPFLSAAADVPAIARREGLSLEDCARRERYRLLESLAEPGELIATAHTMTDNAETLLLRLCRGSGLRGLGGIQARRGNIVRPLLECTRADTEEYCRRNGLPWMEDSSNRDIAHSRNRVRHNVLPQLRQLNPSLEETLSRSMALLARDEDYLASQARELYARARQGERLAAAPLLAAHPALRSRALGLFLEGNGAGVSAGRIALLEKLLLEGGALQAGNRLIFRLRDGFLEQADLPRKRAAGFAFPLEPGALPLPTREAPVSRLSLPLGDGRELTVLLTDCKYHRTSQKNAGNLLKNAVDYDTIRGIAEIRSRRPGDRFALPGRGVSKTLKKLWNEDHIPPRRRDFIPLLADRDGVLWVEGYGACPRAAAGPDCRYALELLVSGSSEEVTPGKIGADKEMRNDILKVLISEEELAAKVRELGRQISEDYRDKNLLMVSVLKGSVVFMADLMRAIDIHARIDFMCVSSYGNSTSTSGEVKIIKDLGLPLEGYDLLLVEDILDSGKTLHYLTQILARRNPASIRIATLLDKPERRVVDLHPDYCCFSVPDEFVVGYGLDYAEKYRNLPFVGVLKPEVYQSGE